jgi:hypothetical protein
MKVFDWNWKHCAAARWMGLMLILLQVYLRTNQTLHSTEFILPGEGNKCQKGKFLPLGSKDAVCLVLTCATSYRIRDPPKGLSPRVDYPQPRKQDACLWEAA